jgi:hypothetical protein
MVMWGQGECRYGGRGSSDEPSHGPSEGCAFDHCWDGQSTTGTLMFGGG